MLIIDDTYSSGLVVRTLGLLNVADVPVWRGSENDRPPYPSLGLVW